MKLTDITHKNGATYSDTKLNMWNHVFDPNDEEGHKERMEKLKDEGSIQSWGDGETSTVDAVASGFKSSVAMNAFMKEAAGTHNFGEFYTPKSKEEYYKLLKMCDYNMDVLKQVTEGTDTWEGVEKNLDIHNYQKEEYKRLTNAGILGSLAGNVANFLGNPIDVASTAVPGGAIMKGGRLLTTALGAGAKASKAVDIGSRVGFNVVSGVAASKLQDPYVGVDTPWAMNAATIGALSLGLDAGSSLFKAGVNVRTMQAKMLAGEKIASDTVSGLVANKTFPLYRGINDMREQVMSGLPTVEAKSKLLELRNKVDSAMLRDFLSRVTHFEQGVRDAEGKTHIASANESRAIEVDGTRINNTKTTFFEEVNGFRVEDRRVMEDTRIDISNLCKGSDRTIVNEYLYRKMSGYDVSDFAGKLDTELADKVAARLTKGLERRGALLVQHGIIDKIYKYGKYVPVVIDRYKIAALREKFGSRDALQKYLSKNMMDGVLNDATHLEYFHKIFVEEMKPRKNKVKVSEGTAVQVNEKEFKEWLQKQADDAAFGYADQNRSRGSGATGFDEHSTSLSFTKKRLPWNTAYKGADGFSINDIRGDIVDSLDRYFRRSSGELASRRTFGRGYNDTIKMFDDLINDARNKAKITDKEADEAKEIITGFIKRGYGMATSDAEYGVADALSAIARNLSYSAYGTLMGVLNYGEIAGALRAYGASMLVKTLPGVGEVIRSLSKKELSKEDVTVMKNYFVGQDVAKRLGVREIMRSSREMYKDVPKYLQDVVGISKVLSDYSPASYMMNYSNQTILDTVQNTFWSEMIIKAHGGEYAKRGFLRDIDLHRNNITKDEFNLFMANLKQKTRMGANGEIKLKKSFKELADNPDFTMVLRRLTDYVSNETIQRRGLDDMFVWQIGKGHPFLSLAMQFKSFALQSYNKRLVKLMNRMEDEGLLASLNELAIGGAISSAVTIAQLQLRALGMEDEQREKFLNSALGVASFDELTPEKLVDVTASLASRVPPFAGISLALNSLGVGTKAKTTASTNVNDYGEDDWFLYPPKIMDTVGDMIPSARIAQDTVNGLFGLANLGRNAITDDDDFYKRRRTQWQINGLFGVLPNIPYITPATKNTFNNWMNDSYTGAYQ